MMPRILISTIVALTTVVVACASTPESRIEENQEKFDRYPAETQAILRSGKVDIGYDQDMVRIALGDPDETSTEISDEGEMLIWAYIKSRPRVSIGIGGGGYGGRGGLGGLGGGVGVGSGGTSEYTAIVEFRAGRVTRARYFDR